MMNVLSKIVLIVLATFGQENLYQEGMVSPRERDNIDQPDIVVETNFGVSAKEH